MPCFTKFLGIISLLTAAQTAAWSIQPQKTPTKHNENIFQKTAASILVASTIALASPHVALAGTDDLFTGSYADPNHPKCARLVAVEENNKVLVSGADGIESKSCIGGEGKPWFLVGKLSDDRKELFVDFSPKVRSINDEYLVLDLHLYF